MSGYTATRPMAVAALRVAFLLMVSAALLTPSQALGHVEYESSDPAAESVLTTAPTEVVVVFDGEIGEAGSALEVYGPDGSRVDNDDLRLDLDDLDRRRLIVTLPPTLGDGIYRVQVGGASIDGHTPELQEFTFTIAAGNAQPAAATPALATPLATPGATPVGTPEATPIALVAASTEGAQPHSDTSQLSWWVLAAMAVVAGLPFLFIGWRNRREQT